jgi:hypothetical protein
MSTKVVDPCMHYRKLSAEFEVEIRRPNYSLFNISSGLLKYFSSFTIFSFRDFFYRCYYQKIGAICDKNKKDKIMTSHHLEEITFTPVLIVIGK